ncbi:hypothetical protein [Streptomyces showdoensis]|uniref:Uncharacterized protein n=1 Tax=Streptomyces showdoensis TaxID=68268 RepID=A0A2P2GS63_STREW|nr:hypothetical protein [Streptomyces showdoensis]KKZ74340.1 hypothetical protein VO63_07790 [Streptomyces showdoensis]
MAARIGRPKHCTYCTETGADCCVRVQPDTGRHIYAHRDCAGRRGVKAMYVFLDDAPRIGAPR